MFNNPSIIPIIYLLIISMFSSYFTLELRSIQRNMYLISSFDYCMRYLTKNSITGCSSSKTGHQGQLLLISSIDELKLQDPSLPIIILIPAQKDLLEYAIHHCPFVVGILLDSQTFDNDNNNNLHFTEVNTCPENFNSSTTCSIRKNKYGIDFRRITIDKPIFLLTNQTIIEQIKEILMKYNQKQSNEIFIQAHMKSYPFAVENADICNRRSKKTYFGEAYFRHYAIKCRSPMINIVWSTLNTISKRQTRPAKSVIIFYTKTDFFSVFQPKTAGVQSTAYGVITLLGLAWAFGRINLSEILISNKHTKDILLVFLNGDNWNYYGRYELTKLILDKNFPPIEVEHIDIMINIDQLGINSEKTYVLYDKLHPFIQNYSDLSPTTISLQPFPETFDSLSDFHQLNISCLAILTNAYENMNSFYNSYHDTLVNHKINLLSIQNQINLLLKTVCIYLNTPLCRPDLSIEHKQTLTNRIEALFDCFHRFDCTKISIETNETGQFYYKDISDGMKENFSFLQPFLHQSDAKTYINQHFLDASSYIHDILLNWLAIRQQSSTKISCENQDNHFYQESTQTCLSISINSINLIRNTDELIDERLFFISNSDQPELLIYLINTSSRNLIILICGIILCLSGFILSYFLNKLLPFLLVQERKS